jgi:hypothetical protein
MFPGKSLEEAFQLLTERGYNVFEQWVIPPEKVEPMAQLME